MYFLKKREIKNKGKFIRIVYILFYKVEMSITLDLNNFKFTIL